MPSLPALRVVPAALVAALTFAGCGDGGPSIRAGQEPTSTSSSSTTSTTTDPSVTTTTAAPVVDGQVIEYRGLRLVVPTDWPVYDLAAEPRTCVRVDRHAVYLGVPGPDQDCPAHAVGHTATVILQPLTGASDVVVARATQPATINGIAVRTDPDPDANGALTIAIPELDVLAYFTYGASRATADELVAGLTRAPA